MNIPDKDLEYELQYSDHPINPRVLNADFNGDGEMDYIIYANPLERWAKFSEVGGQLTDFTNIHWVEGSSIMNYNGNKKPDLAIKGSPSKILEFSKETGKFEELYTGASANPIYRIGDFSGDGLSDLCYPVIDTTGAYIKYGTGDGFDTKSAPFAAHDDDSINNDRSFLDFTDFNNDGKTDIIRYYFTVSLGVQDSMYYWYIYLNANVIISKGGNRFYSKPLFSGKLVREQFIPGQHKPPNMDYDAIIPNTIAINSNSNYMRNDIKWSRYDFNSDGNGDILLYDPGEQGVTMYSMLLGNQPGLVSAITNGVNINTKFTYANLYDNQVYTRNSSGTYPVFKVINPTYVVKRIETQNNGNTYKQMDYSYEDASVHKEYGFLGFKKRSSLNSQTNVRNTLEFAFLGGLFKPMILNSSKEIEGGNIISTNVYRNEVVTISPSKNTKYFQYRVTNKNHNNYLTSVHKSYAYNDYNNYNQPTEIVKTYGGGDMEVTTNISYFPDVSGGNWLPLRVGSKTVTKNRDNGVTDFLETTTFIYKAANPHRLSIKKTRDGSNLELSEYYTYKSFGPVKKIEVTDGNQTRSKEFVYTPDHRFIKEETRNNQFKTTYTYDPFGNLLEKLDHNGNATTYEYNGFGELTKTTFPDGNVATKNKHWGAGNGPGGTLYYKQNHLTGKGTTKTFYNRKGQLLREITPGPLGRSYKTDYEYYPDGKLYKEYMPYESDKDDYTEYTYDEYGRNIDKITPQGTVNTDYMGYGTNSIKITTPEGWTEKTFDDYGLVTSVQDDGGTISYTYNERGLVKKIFYNGNETLIGYDDAGNRNGILDPNAGAISSTYNAFGEMTSNTDANNNTYTMQYDNFGRIISRECGDDITTWDYHPQSGELIEVVGQHTSIEYDYDDTWMFMEKETEVIDGQNFETQYTYNSFGDVATITYPGGFGVRNIYDSHGNIIEMEKLSDNNSIWQLDNVNDNGMLTHYSYGNGITTQTGYDNNYRPDYIQTNIINFHRWDYNFDASGNLDYRKNLVTGMQEDFAYDNLNRLTSCYEGDIDYTDDGNIDHKTGIGDYNYNTPKPHAVSKVTNPSDDYMPVSANISYTSFNKVKSIVGAETGFQLKFTYGPDKQRRIMETIQLGKAAETKYYVGPYEKTENALGEEKECTYITTPSGLAAVHVKDFDNSEKLYYIHTDYLGSIMGLTDESGNIAAEYFYDAWGQPKDPGTWQNKPIFLDIIDRGYTGHEHLPYFDLINMNGRVYDPHLGRFLSPDPYVQAPGFTQNYNRYSYVLNNPLKYTDPSGYYIQQSKDEQQRSEQMVSWGYFSGSSYGGSYMTALMEYEEQLAIDEFYSNNISSGTNNYTLSQIIGWSLNALVSAPKNSYTYYNLETGVIYQYDLEKTIDDFYNDITASINGVHIQDNKPLDLSESSNPYIDVVNIIRDFVKPFTEKPFIQDVIKPSNTPNGSYIFDYDYSKNPVYHNDTEVNLTVWFEPNRRLNKYKFKSEKHNNKIAYYYIKVLGYKSENFGGSYFPEIITLKYDPNEFILALYTHLYIMQNINKIP